MIGLIKEEPTSPMFEWIMGNMELGVFSSNQVAQFELGRL